MSMKEGYFFKRNKELTNYNSELLRYELGQREVRTLRSLAQLYGISLSGFKDKRILDLGCADQHVKKPLEEQGGKYIGLDIEDLNFETDSLPIQDNSIDVVMSLAVIEHIHNPEIFLNEIYRVLKPGGFVYLSTPNFKLCFKDFYNDCTHVKPYTPESLEMVLGIFNFQNPQTFPGLRCKPNWYYTGKYRFFKASKLLPFNGDQKFAPSFLKGKATSIFAIGTKAG